MKLRKITALVLMTVLLLSLSACVLAPGSQTDDAPVKVMVLNGTTGFGLANLMSKNAKGDAKLNYEFQVETDASNINSALINKTVDIAALPTNAASVVYNRTDGEVQVLALNTLGVLYLLSDGTTPIESFEDLRGKTVYAPAQNPSFIFRYLCQANGLTVGKDVFIDNSFSQPAELNAAVGAGQVSLAVLPEPMVTIARTANKNLQVALDLTEEWDKVAPAGSLVQGCVVVRTEFAKKYPEKVATFLKEYEASMQALQDDVAGTALKIQEVGIFAKSAVAEKAIPNCNVCFITGKDMKQALSKFLEIMYGVAPASVGGALPGEDFYYVGA